uniref:Uromodulin like 1 n=1 Tax=Sciurus vulgaris TaxID=55149 RepID=A0A8D2D2Z1_SCIVU
MEDDCVPGTSCQNTLGSFTCRCQGGAPDSRVEHSGRRCGSPGNLTQAPSPERPPMPVGTKAALMPGGARPAPQDLHPRLNLTGAVRVLCEIEKVAIAIRRRFLQQEAIPESSLYLGQPSCNVSSSNSTHVLLVASWGECGTLVHSNLTNTVVRTVLRSDLSPEGIIHHLKILSPIHCTFRNDLLTSLGYAPEWGLHTVLEDLHGAGNFVTKMQLFVGDSPIPQNHSVSASDYVKIQVGLYRQTSQLKVVLTECWATPSSNAGDPLTFGFINNSCPVPNTYTSVIENGNSSKAQFKLRVFSFINNSVVYLHCRLRVCVESPRATCRISCVDMRAAWSLTWGLSHTTGAAACAKPGLGTGYLILIVVAGFAVVAGVDFKIQLDDFSYQVFSEEEAQRPGGGCRRGADVSVLPPSVISAWQRAVSAGGVLGSLTGDAASPPGKHPSVARKRTGMMVHQ